MLLKYHDSTFLYRRWHHRLAYMPIWRLFLSAFKVHTLFHENQ